VQALELGDFSVTYRVAGFLDEVKHLLTARSNLRKSVLDALHEGGVEIVSPTYMNQRQIDPEAPVIPSERRASKSAPGETSGGAPAPESLIFEKAEEAEAVEELREKRGAAQEEIERIKGEVKEAKGDEDAKSRLTADLERAEKALERLDARIEGEEEKGK